MLESCWQSSDHCRHRAQEELGKAMRAPPLWLRVHHLEAAERWYARADALADRGLWDRLPLGDEGRLTAARGGIESRTAQLRS